MGGCSVQRNGYRLLYIPIDAAQGSQVLTTVALFLSRVSAANASWQKPALWRRYTSSTAFYACLCQVDSSPLLFLLVLLISISSAMGMKAALAVLEERFGLGDSCGEV